MSMTIEKSGLSLPEMATADEDTGTSTGTTFLQGAKKYVDQGVVSSDDLNKIDGAKKSGFMASPENAMFLALFESAREKGLTIELQRIDTSKGSFDFKIKAAEEKLDGAVVSLVMTTAGSVLGVGVGAKMAHSGLKKNPDGTTSSEASGMENMSGLVGGAILQTFKSAGEVGEAAIGVDAAESQAFADLFEQNYQTLSSNLNHLEEQGSGTLSGLRI